MNERVVSFGDVAEFINGGAWSQEEYTENGVPVVRVSDIHNHTVELDACKFLPKSALKKYLKNILRKDDVLICTVGSHPTQPNSVVGRAAVVPAHCDGALLNQNAVCIQPNEELLNKTWLGYLVRSDEVKNYIISHARGSASQVRIAISALKNFSFYLPSLENQMSVAEVLKSYDKLIENNTHRITILETMAQNLYREWFVNFRFPGHEQSQWQDTPQGKIPLGWNTVELGEKITVRRGKTITKKTAIPKDVPVVAGGLQPAYFHNVANTTSPVITVSASGANAGYVNLYTVPVWASDCSYIDTETTSYVYYYYLLMKERQVEITRMQTGAAQPHVYPKDLMRLEVFDVPTGLLDDFTERVTPVFQLMANLVTKNNNLQQQRDLLLPKLVKF